MNSSIVYWPLSFIFPFFLMANFNMNKIQKVEWDGIPVVFLEDERFPTYTLSIYFEEGAASDNSKRSGETEAMFHLLTAGSSRYEEKDIIDNLDFFGARYGAHVTHEYSSYQVAGLLKDIIPTMKKICHLFTKATFPPAVVKREINRSISALDNLVSDHRTLATRVFRKLSMQGTPYGSHVEGTMKSLKRIRGPLLKRKLHYFNKMIGKRIYLSGPREVLGIRDTILKDCGWTNETIKTEKNVVAKKFSRKPQIYLVTVPKANQAQVRMGRYLNKNEGTSVALNSLLSDYMSGGLSGKMLRELRTKRGLIYSGGVILGKQRDYGRALISTYTQNAKVVELVNVIKALFEQAASGKITRREFTRIQGRLVGRYPFMFEENASFLQQLLVLDHTEKDYSTFFNFRKDVLNLKIDDMFKGYRDLFDWSKMTILVLGDRSLKTSLDTLGEVIVRDYKEFL